MAELRTDDPNVVRAAGAIDLETIQRYINFWFSSAVDLFGSESSSNAATYFASGLKGRPNEADYDDHLALNQVFAHERPDGRGGVAREEIPLRNALNETIRSAYVDECAMFMERWNQMIAKAGVGFRYRLPSRRFNRRIGAWAGSSVDPEGRPISAETFAAHADEWLPSAADRAFVHSLMRPVSEPGKMAAWIAPPERGINDLAADYDYVRLA